MRRQDDRSAQTTATPTPQLTPTVRAARSETASASAQGAPLLFVENVGQFDRRAAFQVNGSGATIRVSADDLWFTLLEKREQNPRDPRPRPTPTPRKGVHLQFSFEGANPRPRLEAFNRLTTRVSYFIGNDPTNWHADVPVWGGVRYVDFYAGLDLELTSVNGRWQPRLVVRCDANLSAVRLRVNGAKALALKGRSQINLTTDLGDWATPLLQVVKADGSPYPLAGLEPRVVGNMIVNPFAQPDGASAALESAASATASDLLYSTYLGGGGDEVANAIAIDASGAAYVTGYTDSTDFPTTPGSFTYQGGDDTFITKLNAAGSSKLYSTYLGGSGGDRSFGIAVDSSGNAYIAGETTSTNYPFMTGAFRTAPPGSNDAFITKLNANSNGLLYSTYLGGSGLDTAYGIAVDANRIVYVTGETNSANFPFTASAYQTSCSNACSKSDAFVSKLNPADNGAGDLLYSSFLGGSEDENGDGVTVDASGAIYLTGSTSSANFPTRNAFQPTYGDEPGRGVAVVPQQTF